MDINIINKYCKKHKKIWDIAESSDAKRLEIYSGTTGELMYLIYDDGVCYNCRGLEDTDLPMWIFSLRNDLGLER